MTPQALEIVDDSSFRTQVLDRPHPMLVVFTRTGCAPCGMLLTCLPALAPDLDGRTGLVRCAIEASPLTARRYGIRRAPTLLLFAGERLVASHTGASPLPVIRAWVRDALRSGAAEDADEREDAR